VSSRKQEVLPGSAARLGATFDGEGTNFALFSAHAEKVELCVYDGAGEREIGRHTLPEASHQIWSAYLPGVGPDMTYGYRVHGPYDPQAGHRFNAKKLLLDPYARGIRGDFSWHKSHFGFVQGEQPNDLIIDLTDNARWMPKAMITAAERPDCAPPASSRPRGWERAVVYEAHVRGFTMLHPDVPESLRGTFVGMSQPRVIEYLKSLGITSVELLPVQMSIDEYTLQQKGLVNYWGYNSLNFFTPHPGYQHSGDPLEFRQMVDRFHDAGLEVILDVVYNHTCEGNQLGPTLSFKGIDNASYYRLRQGDKRFYVDDSGCGNTLNISHPQVLRLVMDSLRYWVEVMGVDGFRFDLGTILGREERGFSAQHSFFQVLAQDPVLARVHLIAEPWDIGPGGYQLGAFPPGWSEWNDRYRDTVRRFWRGDSGVLPELARRLHGSSDLFEHHGRAPSAGINFVTSHDGFTLADLVSYGKRHNEANGETNRDGHHSNYSDNFGVEGVTANARINAARLQQQKNFLATLLVSQGVPMLLAGDEFGRTQQGNNNAYCQDNALNWVDWGLLEKSSELLSFTRSVINLRQQYAVLRFPAFVHLSNRPGEPGIHWLNCDGQPMRDEHWHEHQNKVLGYLLIGESDGVEGGTEKILVVFNGGLNREEFQLPLEGPESHWQLLLDTSCRVADLDDTLLDNGESFMLPPRNMRILQAVIACELDAD